MKGVLAAIAMLTVTACGGGPSLSARVISTLNTIGTGEQRVLVELRDEDGELLALRVAPDATFRNENGSPLGVYPGELVWVVPESQPAYAFVVDIPEAETYQLTVDGGAYGETPPAGFVAVESPFQVVAGEPAPSIEGQDVRGPVMVVFASPDRCPSKSCQPMIDQAKALSAEHGLAFRSVDVFVDPDEDVEDDLELSADVEGWGLISQPWLYAVDSAGVVAAVFEGAVSDAEIEAAIDLISG